MSKMGLHDANRRPQSDLAVGEYVDAQAAAVDEWPQQSRPAEAIQMDAGLAQPTALAEDLADVEGATDQCVDVDAAGQDVATGAGELQCVPGRGELVEHLRGDEGQVVAGAPVGAGAEGAGARGVPVAVESTPGVGPCGV